jgi:hypothetical protein
MNKEDIILLVVALVVFAGVFYAAKYFRPAETNVNGVRVIGENWQDSITQTLSSNSIVIREELVNASDRRNSAVGAMGAELARAMRMLNKTVAAYGVVEGMPTIGCNAASNNCTGEQIVIRAGTCDCIDTRNNTVLIEGSADFLLDNLVNVRDITYGVLAKG